MAEFPALPIWTDALIGDTYHLSAAEFGAYMRLLICAWRTPECAIPDDDKTLGRMIGDPRVWKRVRETVLEFWDMSDDGLWRQKRLTRERAFVTNRSLQKKTAAEARWLKNKNSGDANGCQPHMQPTPTPTPTPNSSSVPNGTDADASADLDALLYQRGRKLLGPKAGAMITKLRRATGSVGAALDALELAKRKDDPATYVAGICNAKSGNRALAELQEVLEGMK